MVPLSLNPPLRCFFNLEGDEFSGWYAISNPFTCNDFCFWSSSNQTRDPHQSTRDSKDNTSWLCAYNAALDTRRWNVVLSEAVPYHDQRFDYLRCSRGPLQVLSSFNQRMTRSKRLWISLVSSASLLVLIEVAILIYFIHRRKRLRTRISYSETHSRARSSQVRCTIINIGFVCLFGIFIVTTVLLSIFSISLHEQQSTYDYTQSNLQLFTPSCVSPWKVCLQGNQAMDRESSSSFFHSNSLNTVTPFSYMIASDAQLNWYDGESPYTTNWPLPLSCHAYDTCNSCTNKVATYTNSQMKKAMERLINSPNRSEWITPKTLVMNGDLTSYFHPEEKTSFESFYHSINGLVQYFPSLGNHDYDHYEGASYHGDEWLSPHDCNAIHAVRYIKNAFCQGIPKFDAMHRLTRYDNKSLAYSWDEMNYHFVHLHYYPLYENARLGISSSLEWLERDLTLASGRNRTTILLVHAVEGFPIIMKDILLNKNVKAIFSGHQHKCLGRKCHILQPLTESEVQRMKINNNNNSSMIPKENEIHTCFPAGTPLCGGNANTHGMSLFDTAGVDMKSNPLYRKTTLFAPKVPMDLVCPVSNDRTFVNHTDNTLLCRRIEISPSSYTLTDNSSIPIFWSGSISFLTFLKVDFYYDKFIVHVHTAEMESEGKLYLDVHTVPNIIYPYHSKDDLVSQTIEVFYNE